jgi:hypothetical protein
MELYLHIYFSKIIPKCHKFHIEDLCAFYFLKKVLYLKKKSNMFYKKKKEKNNIFYKKNKKRNIFYKTNNIIYKNTLQYNN